ncbi:Laccase I [Mycena sanguinolenta]|uniref:Laccase I n=1 Tax=Mycena sanguinolenta TaxID=230812 RepID=A0A8H6YND6_9AGAR|nr:Laccase I [Mycena sanguinolenta]
MILFSAFVFLSTLSTASAAIGPTGTLDISNAQISPDGLTRSAVLAGSTFPGPLIQANLGDTMSINVVNALTDNTMLKSTSIHWHGIVQNKTNWEDGPAFITRLSPVSNRFEPLSADGSTSNIRMPDNTRELVPVQLRSAELSGTTVICQRNIAMGFADPWSYMTPTIPKKSLYDIDDETTIITLSDWYHYPSPQHPTIPVFNSTLINGRGRYPGGPLTDLAVINVVQGKRYRFRLISMSCDPNWIFSIANHQLNIIEVDGVAHQPVTVNSIQIFAGQRYSFVLSASQSVDNYWIQALPQSGTNLGVINATNSAILRYIQPHTRAYNRLKYTGARPTAAWGADTVLNLTVTLNTTNFHFGINNVTFVSPTVPVLLQILSGTQAAQNLLPKGSVIELQPNKVIEVNIPGGSAGSPHPFHLHGKLIFVQHTFHVTRSAGSSIYNFVNPVIRDVVATGPLTTDLTSFRFVTDNAGPWFLHCHIDWHLDVGLAVVFAENIPQIAQETPPVSWQNLCPAYDASPMD